MRRASFRIAGFLTAVLLTVLMASTASASVTLPGGLTAIETEAFMGDRAMTGLVRIPAGVNTVREDAFTDTGVFAMELPATVRTVEAQRLSGLTYMRIESRSADLVSLPDTLKYIASPKGGLVQYYANFHHVDFYPIDTLIADGGLYYVPNDTGLTLLSAVDNSAVPASVTIPENVDGQWVNAVSAYAFAGCPQVTGIALPVAAEGHVPASAMADCSGARVSYYGNGPLVIKSVKASNEEPLVGEAVTFTVEVEGGTGPYTVEYEIFKKGSSVLISSGKRSGSQFDYCFEEAGDYIVSVIVKDNNAYAASKDLSETIFANQFRIILPESLQAGKDLKIEVDPIGNLDYYSVFIKDAADDSFVYGNGFGIDYLSFTVDGCLFESNHTYLIETYVYTRDGKEEKLENESLTITGQKPDAPIVVTEPSVVYSGKAKEIEYVHLELDQKDFERFRIKRTPATTYDYGDFYGNNYVDPWVDQDCELQVAVFKDGLWSEWSSPINIEYVIEEPPLVAIINEELYAGQPFSILIGEKLNATGYGVGVYDTNSRYSEQIYYNYYEHAGTFTLDDIAPYLHAGPYRLVVSAYVNQIEVKKNIDFMVLDQERPSKPLVRLQMPTEATPTDLQSTEEITTVALNVPANRLFMLTICSENDIDELYIKHNRNGEDGYEPDKTHIKSTDKITRVSERWGENYIDDSFTYQVSVKQNGVWSEWSDTVRVYITEPEPLKQAVIHLPDEIIPGKDLTVTIDSAENVVYYDVKLTNVYEYPNDSLFRGNYGAGNITIPGYHIHSGEYMLRVQAFDEEENSSIIEKRFTVTGESIEAPHIEMSKTTFAHNEAFRAQIATSDATMICYRNLQYVERNPNGYWTIMGDEVQRVLDITMEYNSYADRNRKCLVSLKRNNLWSEWAEIAPVIVEKGTLAEINEKNITVSNECNAGQDMIVTFDPVENSSYYQISMNCNNPSMYYSGIAYVSNPVFTIPGYYLEEGTYTLSVIACADNYNSTFYTKTVKIVGNREGTPIVSLLNKTGELPIGSSSSYWDFCFDISNLQAEKIAIRKWSSNSYDTQYNEYLLSSGQETINQSCWVTLHNIYRFSFATYKDGKWSDWSPAIRIPVE